VDPAVTPEMRVKPKRKLMVLSGGALGFFLGVLLAFAINLFRQVRARPAEV
ncbi:MAG: GNVR domain-containing protein, partial [Pseudomonadota bacterium]